MKGALVEPTMVHLALRTELALEACCALAQRALNTGPFQFDAENETEWGEAVAADGITVNVSRPYCEGTLRQWDGSVPEGCNVGITLWPGDSLVATSAARALAAAFGETVHFHRIWTGPGQNTTIDRAYTSSGMETEGSSCVPKFGSAPI